MALREFDVTIATHLDTSMKKSGIKIQNHSITKEIVKEQDGTLSIHLQNGEVFFKLFLFMINQLIGTSWF